MNSISLINKEKLSSIIKFIDDNKDEYSYFKKIGWSLKNIESQFNKVNNYSLGYFKANNLVGLLIGDAITNNKDYELEVYDLSGRKLMQATGNTLDMSVLSNATYIVKAFDKETKETNSYKVVKK